MANRRRVLNEIMRSRSRFVRLQVRKALVIAFGSSLSVASYLDLTRTAYAGTEMEFAVPNSAESRPKNPRGDVPAATLRSGPRVAADARQHIKREPLTPLAIALIAQKNGSENQSGLQLTERLTRRNSGLQLALVNEAALSGDLPRAISHLDKALRVQPELGQDVLPNLVPAIADPNFRKAMQGFADKQWVWDYLAIAGKDQTSRVDAGDFILESRDLLRSAQPLIQQSGVKILVRAERYEDAQDLVVAIGSISKKAMKTFTPISENSMQGLEPMTWKLARTEVAAVLLSDDGSWQATIEPGRKVPLMQRVTNFAAGDYLISGQVSTDDERIGITMSAYCVSNDFEVAFASWQPRPPQMLTIEMPFRVPDGCESQIWTLDVSSLNANRTITLNSGRFETRPL